MSWWQIYLPFLLAVQNKRVELSYILPQYKVRHGNKNEHNKIFHHLYTTIMPQTSAKKPHYHGHRLRLRQRLVRDSTQLQDYEILELLLGIILTRCDTKPLAKELLDIFGSLRGILDAHPAELSRLKGVGPALSSFLLLQREVMARYAEAPARVRNTIVSTLDVAHMARVRLAACPHEEAWCAFMDNQSRLLAWERLSRGTVNTTIIYPREVLEMALRFKAMRLIIVHNHPAGTPEPSKPDIEITNIIKTNAANIGITLHDHVIVTDHSCYSLLEKRFLD